MTTAIISPIRTTSSTSASPAQARPAQARLRITRRGRIVLTTLVALPLLLVVALLVLNGGGASAGNTTSHASFETVTIMPGESLWQLAEHEAPHSDPREFVQAVVTLNDLQSSAVQAGQRIAIPAEYASAAGH